MKKHKSSPQPTSPRQHVTQLVKWMSTDVYEKDHLVAVALLCAIAGENMFLLGPPGTAKSMIASRLKGVFAEARSFDYLMSRFSTPDEIFGPVSISRLKEHDRYERLTDGYLPDAHVVFLDEIWKAGPAIQNSLLTAINEHIYYNGGKAQQIPMKALIAASNELPAPDEGLEALWDRFLMRMISNCIESDSSFIKMIESPRSFTEPLDPELLITDELYSQWQSQAAAVKLTDRVKQSILYVRQRMRRLETDDGCKLRFYVSDRRWRKAYNLMQVSAFLNDRTEINLSDFFLLVHAFWNDVDTITAVVDTFSESISASIKNDADEIERVIRNSMKNRPEQKARNREPESFEPIVYDYFYYKLDGYPAGDIYFSKWDYTTLTDATRQGVRYLDTARRKLMIRALTPGSDFDAKAQNATDVSRVALRKSPTGIYVDNVHYNFVTGSKSSDKASSNPSRSAKLKDLPVYQRVEALQTMLNSATEAWDETVKQLRDNPNIFFSKADAALFDKALKESETTLKTVAVRLNNLRSML